MVFKLDANVVHNEWTVVAMSSILHYDNNQNTKITIVFVLIFFFWKRFNFIASLHGFPLCAHEKKMNNSSAISPDWWTKLLVNCAEKYSNKFFRFEEIAAYFTTRNWNHNIGILTISSVYIMDEREFVYVKALLPTRLITKKIDSTVIWGTLCVMRLCAGVLTNLFPFFSTMNKITSLYLIEWYLALFFCLLSGTSF